MPRMNRPRVLLADDHAETAGQLSQILGQDFEVIGVVADGRALVEAADRLSPDVIVTDISMPRLDGIDATVLIRRGDPAARIVLVTVHTEVTLVQRGFDAGASGYVLKDESGEELVAAVRAALKGERYVSRSIRGREA